jgi:GrpB-like predicted nucleotidyltransferase (UPF0157 family)
MMTLGLPVGHNYLVVHDPAWADLFEEERRRLRSALPADAIEIEHVGSTAVPGLKAKPIIDIAIAARRCALADDWQGAMASLGYDYPGDLGIAEHRIYGRDPGMRRFLVHVVDAGGPRWRDFLRFRDQLRGDPLLAAAYEALKLHAAAMYPTGSRSGYTRAKAEFIESALARERNDKRV